ncbi:hypothetical protein OZX60_03395 [Streptococcaceae bacterium ESL0687]|nr:hypothetical protein OZX60_03395 [Streptococcaceae bacterium ESL0687]
MIWQDNFFLKCCESKISSFCIYPSRLETNTIYGRLSVDAQRSSWFPFQKSNEMREAYALQICKFSTAMDIERIRYVGYQFLTYEPVSDSVLSDKVESIDIIEKKWKYTSLAKKFKILDYVYAKLKEAEQAEKQGKIAKGTKWQWIRYELGKDGFY